MKKLLLNPFENTSETKLLLFGLALTAAGSYLAYLFNGRYDGVIDLHFIGTVTLLQPFLDNLINIACLASALFLTGKLINKKTRFIDILNPVLIARVPFYLLTLTNFNNFISDITESLLEKIDLKNMPTDIDIAPSSVLMLTLFSLLAIVCIIWFVILLYNGFKIAANSKTSLHKVYFALSILAAEIISGIAISLLNY